MIPILFIVLLSSSSFGLEPEKETYEYYSNDEVLSAHTHIYIYIFCIYIYIKDYCITGRANPISCAFGLR